MAKVLVKFFDNENNIVLVPVSDTDPVPPPNLKPAESYADAKKRNYNPRRANRFLGSVLFHGRG